MSELNGSSSSLSPSAKCAVGLGQRGFRVFPVVRFSKEPAIKAWQEAATNHPEVVKPWFVGRERNVGLACGPQPNGLNIVVVDIDSHHGGEVAWREFIVRTGLDIAAVMTTAIHRTPNGGWHVFFDAPEEFRNSRARIGEGIDTRGAGGFVVLPPSSVPDVDGVVQPYLVWSKQALWNTPLLPLPPEIAEALAAPVAVAPIVRSTPSSNGSSAADRLRESWNWDAELSADGWRHVKDQGGDRFWARPGKTDRGHSAVVHESGAFVVFSTEVPELERVGHVTRDGTGFTVSPFEYFAAMRHGGDLSAAGRALTPHGVPRGMGALPAGMPVEDGGGSVLDDAFWSSDPVLSRIFTAARARMCSPSALLVNCLARTATLIPPSWRLPAVIGSQATLDYMGCVVAPTAAGKSIANDVAADLIPDLGRDLHEEDRQILFDYPVGSGEGIAQAFLVPEYKEDPESGKSKRTGRQVVGRQALHLVVDEAKGFVAQSSRVGSTIVATLASAWSGKTLGALNAGAETRRVIRGGRVRVAAVFNMQTANAHLLFTDEMVAIGFVGRVLFGTAVDPEAPKRADMPDWPGPLEFTPPAHYSLGTREFTYDDEIIDEIIDIHRKVLSGQIEVDQARSHYTLLRCKTAAILAVWAGKTHIDMPTWANAGSIVEASFRHVGYLNAVRSTHLAQTRHSAAVARGEDTYTTEEVKEAKAVAKLAESLRQHVPLEGIGRGKLGRSTTSSTTRHRFDAALNLAVKNGWVRINEGRVERT